MKAPETVPFSPITMNYQAPPFQPLKLFPPGLKESILDLTVSSVNAVAHARLPSGGNHWCFYFNIGQNDFICVDITPSYIEPSVVTTGGSKALLVVSRPNSRWPNTATKVMRLDTRPGARIGDFVDVLVNHKRHQYEFNALGEGCRYWMDHQLSLFQDSNLLVDAGQVIEVKNAILLQYPDEAHHPLIPGTYYP